MGNILRNPIALAIIAIALLILIGSTLAIVPETRQAVIVRFGEPVRIINRYKPNQDFGQTGAGLIVRIPFAPQIAWRGKHGQRRALGRQPIRQEEHTAPLLVLTSPSYNLTYVKKKHHYYSKKSYT